MDDQAFVFLDANTLLHFRPPNEIDWPKLCGAERIDLVIYPRLRTEISNQKDMNPRKPLRDRAGARGSQLREWLAKRGEPIRPNVFLHREAREPRELLTELGLDRQVHDDLIIAHAVAYLREGKRVFVVTADGGLEMKLEDQGIRVVVLPDELRLAPEPDPEKQRADRAEAELRAMKNRLPAFEVSAAPPLVLARQRGHGDVEDYVRRQLAAAQAEYEREQRARYGGRQPSRVDSIFEPQYRHHIDAAAEYLRAQHRWLTQSEGAMWTQLLVRNTGSRTATGVRLLLSFPDGVTPFGDGGFGPPPQPRSSGLPAGFAALLAGRTDFDAQMAYSFSPPGDGWPKVDRPNRSVLVAWGRIPQHDQVVSGRIWAVAGEGVRLCDSAIQVSILCEEIGGARGAHLPLTIAAERPSIDGGVDG